MNVLMLMNGWNDTGRQWKRGKGCAHHFKQCIGFIITTTRHGDKHLHATNPSDFHAWILPKTQHNKPWTKSICNESSAQHTGGCGSYLSEAKSHIMETRSNWCVKHEVRFYKFNEVDSMGGAQGLRLKIYLHWSMESSCWGIFGK